MKKPNYVDVHGQQQVWIELVLRQLLFGCQDARKTTYFEYILNPACDLTQVNKTDVGNDQSNVYTKVYR